MMRINIFLICLLLTTSGNIVAQRTMTGESNKGLLFPKTYGPRLEARVIDFHNRSNILFRGATINLDLMVYNMGDVTAKECMIMINPDSQFIRPLEKNKFFSIEPGDSLRIQLSFAVSQYVEPGPVMINIEIEELMGYHLYPPRTLNYFIKERPEFDLTVIDVGIQDRLGLGYFDKFEDVGLFFRVQNCSESTINNVIAYMDILPGTFALSINPELKIGNLKPFETYDIYARVETGISANNIGLHLNLEADQASFSQDFIFEFMSSYKTPDKMISEGCDQFHPQISAGFTDLIDDISLSPKQPQDNRIALIISNEKYLTLENLENSHIDSDLFRNTLISHLGYKNENIFFRQDISMNQIENLFNLEGLEFNQLRRVLRQTRQEIELTIFFTGYGAADLHNGEIYLLPWDFSSFSMTNLYPLMTMFGNLRIWKSTYNIGNITTYLNINYALLSPVGLKNEQKFRIAEFHENNSGFSTFISSSVHQLTDQDGHSTSPFTTLLLEGLQGRADLNQDQSISAIELYRFLSDEFLGLPATIWESQRSFQVPVFLGEDVILF